MVDILLRDLDSVVRCGAIQSRNQVTLLTSFLHFSCHEDEQDFAYLLLTQHFQMVKVSGTYFVSLFSSLTFLTLQINNINTSSNNLCSVSILPYVWYILDLNAIMLNCIAHFLPLLSVKKKRRTPAG